MNKKEFDVSSHYNLSSHFNPYQELASQVYQIVPYFTQIELKLFKEIQHQLFQINVATSDMKYILAEQLLFGEKIGHSKII
jgi:hypothetical protein